MSHSWLQRKRKGDLTDLAEKANLPIADGLLKDDIVEALYDHLVGNETIYGKQADFSEFYGRTGSPIKRERASPSEALTVSKPRRRQTLKRADSEEVATPEKAIVTRTPRTVSRVASRMSQVDIPASPAQLAEVADQSFQVAKTKATELWNRTKIEEAIAYIRDNASSVSAIQTLVLVIEATGFQWNTLVTNPAFDTPPVASLGLNSKHVDIPDAWKLLSSDWWAPATLWALTSWVLPLVFSYFFNLTLRSNTHHKSSSRQSTVDPLTFNIVRAILAYSAYYVPSAIDQSHIDLAGNPGNVIAEDLSWGPFAAGTVATVRNNIPGKYYGMQIGAFVGILVSLYDAALRK